MKLACFHLLNDYSGSPKILKLILSELLDKGIPVDLITSSGGVLDELLCYTNLHKSSYRYMFSTNPVITTLHYLRVQIYAFFLSFRYLLNRDIVFYINTVLPVGPALAGKIMGKRVIYHYHENAKAKGTVYKMLCWCMQVLATDIICVSHYQRSFLKRKKDIYIIPNALPSELIKQFTLNSEQAFERKTILMLSSLKLYKGALEFTRLSQMLPKYNFIWVINDEQTYIDSFIKEYHITIHDNLSIFPRQNNVTPFYNRCSLVLNLSNKEKFIETFGLTALEAMANGIPVIVPTEGGIAEMVQDGINGYKIDVQELDKIADRISHILSDKSLFCRLSTNALQYSKQFNAANMTEQIFHLITKN